MQHPLIDSHVHLDDHSFEADRDAALARARTAGVVAQILPGVDAASWPRIQQLCEIHGDLYPAYGLHPMFMAQHRPEHLDALARQLRDHRPVALGEIGLDFYVEDLPAEPQREYFSRQLELAREFDLPVIVHARRALEEVTLSLRRIGGLRGVVHSFSGSAEQARQLWHLGFHLGIGGPVTYDRAQRLRRIVAHMPLEFLLLETDAPDQPDASHRGQRNEPAHIVEVLHCIAQLRGEDPQDIARASTANARKLFGLNQIFGP
ncbi:TatD family hydrolase [Dyella silvatica]|uniref:TatD family hydrolase n=1 Tax=Dyella silvatica TaxID=2992128 RepID=UPI00225BFE6D|nr:TatD family hydrolase [Dyella silvatica]